MKRDKIGFIIVLSIEIFFICVFIFLTLVMLFLRNTPNIDALKKEQCTFISHEVIYYGKNDQSKKCYIYVEEYEQPLVIDDWLFEISHEEKLSKLNDGDIITVSIKHENGKSSLYLVELYDEEILPYSEYVYETRKGAQIGIVFFSVFNCFCISFLVIEILYFKKEGYSFFLTHGII